MAQVLVSAREIRRIVLQQSKRANVGHIGSALCIAEIIAALYSRVLQLDNGPHSERDRFILSRGMRRLRSTLRFHFVVCFPRASLMNTVATTHVWECILSIWFQALNFSTGSLGHGLSMAVGAALGARMQNSSRRVYCLISDAECNEGAVWEAAAFAGHHRLNQVTAIVDLNGQQAFGLTSEVLDQSNLAARWLAFGWEPVEVDGHNIDALVQAFNTSSRAQIPRVVLARTVFGKGVSFMELGTSIRWPQLPRHSINWHYLPLSDEEYAQAMNEVEGNP